jgi:predicted phage terminase large subunit-like protein
VSLADDIAQCDRETGLTGSFKDFVRLAWPQAYPGSPFSDNFHIGLMCEHYEAAWRGEIRELVINLPPGGSKSSITCVMFPTWGWVRRPADSYIFAAYGQKLVRRDAYTSLELMQSRWFQDRWADRFVVPKVPAVDLIDNDKTGFRLGCTPGGEVTGFHANYQIIDDPNKPEELTKVGLANVKDWMGRTMASRWRRPPAINSRILIMQRLHCDDLSQEMIDNGAVHVCIPANFDPARRTVTTWGKDPRMQQGELMDPVRLPQHLIDYLRRTLGPLNAAAQLDQSPVPEGGAVFKYGWLQFWSTVRQGQYSITPGAPDSLIVGRPSSVDQTIDSWDCAFKDEEESDFVCGQTWKRVGAHFYLFDQEYGRLDFPATVRAVAALATRSKATAKLIEDKANGPAVVATLGKAISGVIAVDPQGGKHSRASASAGLWEAKNVFLPDPAMPGYEWVRDLIVEILSFPRAKNDDRVDAMSQALLYLQENTSYLKAAMAEVRKSWGYQDDGT